MPLRSARAAALLLTLSIAAAASAQPFPDRYVGDLGAGLFLRNEVVRDTGGSVLPAPYVYGDWGRFFARVDTFGVKTLPWGHGHLELAARISTEGFDADEPALRGVGDRGHPLLLGVGTFQRTPIGAIFAYGMHDLRSSGWYLEGTWAGRVDAGRFALYPLLGVEVRSRRYVQHLYGIDAGQAAASGLPAYSPGSSLVPMAGVAAALPITGPWSLQLQWRVRWLGDAIADSPIVTTRTLHGGHVAVTYEFK